MKISRLILLCTALLLSACSGTQESACNLRANVTGSGDLASENRTITPFDTLVINLPSARVELIQGETTRVDLVGDDNLLERIRTQSQSGTLTIDSGYCLITQQDLTVRVTTPDVDAIKLVNAQSLTSLNTLSTERLSLESGGDSQIDLSLIAGNLSVSSEGSSQVLLSGTVNQGQFRLTDDAGVVGTEMRVAEADVNMQGSGTMTLHVDKLLSADLSGNGDLSILGNPKVSTGATDGTLRLKL